jgi:predicted lipoprotein
MNTHDIKFKHALHTFAFIYLLQISSILSCSVDTNIQYEDPRVKLLQNWWIAFLEPALLDLKQINQKIYKQIDVFCDKKKIEDVDILRKSILQAMRALQRQSLFHFGPYTDEPLRFKAKIGTWPIESDQIDALLNLDSLELEESLKWISSFPAQKRGFYVMEYLIYQKLDIQDLLKHKNRCLYLKAISLDLSNHLKDFHFSWSPNHLGFYLNLIENSEIYPTTKMAISEVVNRLWFSIENLRKENIQMPIDLKDITAFEGFYSQNIQQSIINHLSAIESLYFGKKEVHHTYEIMGLDRYINSSNPDLSNRIQKKIDRIYEILLLNTLDFESLNHEENFENEWINQLKNELSILQRLFQVEVISTLGLSLSFNDNDGD